ncbi:hypothetical protein BRC97_02060 [Halobacteriales archaeon QS_6_71_20]|nr:MAG: hypothetical protein BRC97_02060 [Halobacteriales archaeon QS_6_71_20]
MAMEEFALLAVVAGLFALQVAIVVYTGVRRSGGSVRGADPAPGDRRSVAEPAATEPREGAERPERVRDGSVRCHACGARNDDAYEFCRRCTTRLPDGGAVATGRAVPGGAAR